MKELNNISVILPVHELNDETKKLFFNAVESVKTQNTSTVASNPGLTDFASQVNYGVSVAKTEWVSVLEFDDELANIWIKNVITYQKAHENIDIFMPIIVDVDNQNQFVGFTNEAVWAASFSDELGILDNNALLTYQNFNTDGMVIRKSVYEENGGFKPSIKLTFIYEFLLRMTFKDVKVMVIPRFGYKHVNQREESLFANYRTNMDPIEAKWWLSVAKKEYYFSNDRKITYEAQNV
jgi:hypothetical protein